MKRDFKNLFKHGLATVRRRVVPGILAFAIAFSPVYPTVAVVADELKDQDTETVETTQVEAPADTDVVITEETTYQEPEQTDAAVPAEPTDDPVSDETSGTVDAQAPPVDETDATVSEPEVSETLETFEAQTSETTVETADETSATETDAVPAETDETSETSAETEETETTDETTETSETTEVEEVSTIIVAQSIDEYFEIISEFPDDGERIIVETIDDITAIIKPSYGVYFDGTYIVGFDSEALRDEAIDVLAAAGYDCTVDGQVMACGGITDGLFLNAAVNPDATIRVAVIDTGSDLANEAYSVIGDTVADDNGHGTQMAGLVLDECSDAYIISIKALGSDGTGNVTDVYAAIQMAEEMNVDYILLAMSIRNNGKFDALQTLIVSTSAQVVASAGNSNTNAAYYIPASVPGVITIGAIDNDGYKASMSNYGSAVDFYVPAGSTSDAAAIWLGKHIAGTDEYCANAYVCGEGLGDELIDETFDYLGDEDKYFIINAVNYREIGSDYVASSGFKSVLSNYASSSWANSVGRAGHYQILLNGEWQDSVCICPKQDDPDTTHNKTIYTDYYGNDVQCNNGWVTQYGMPTTNGNDLGELTYGQAAYGCVQAARDYGWTGDDYVLVHYIAATIFATDAKWVGTYNGNTGKNQAEPYYVMMGFWGGNHSWEAECKAVAQKIYDYGQTVGGDSNYYIAWYGNMNSGYYDCEQALLVSNPTPTTLQYDSAFYIDKVMTNDQGYIYCTDGTVVAPNAAGSNFSNAVFLSGAQFTVYKDFQNGGPIDARGTLVDSWAKGVYKLSGSNIKWDKNRSSEIFYVKETQAPTQWNFTGTWEAIPAGMITVDTSVYRVEVWHPSSPDYATASGGQGDGTYNWYVIKKVINGDGTNDPVIYAGLDTGGIRVTNFSTFNYNAGAPFGNTKTGIEFSMTKTVGDGYKKLVGNTFNFELYDTTTNTQVAIGSVAIPTTATKGQAYSISWTPKNGMTAKNATTLYLVTGHSYQVRETTLIVNGTALNTPTSSGLSWYKSTAYFYADFTPSTTATSVSYTVNNSVPVDVKLYKRTLSTYNGYVNNNAMYSLAGTQYAIYATQADANNKTNAIITITFDASGNPDKTFTTTNTTGTFYVRELKAGPGYTLDNTVKTIVLSDADASFTYNDYPTLDPFSMTFTKQDPENWNGFTETQMNEATFTFYYYDNVDAYTSFAAYTGSHTPKATGTLTLKQLGFDGDAEITAQDLVNAGITYFQPYTTGPRAGELPLGTYIIKEATAPTGYELTNAEFAWAIVQPTSGGVAITQPITPSNNTYSYTAIEGGTVYLNEHPQFGYGSFTKVVATNNGLEQLAPDLYTLDGTQYGVYTEEDNLVCTITFNAAGNIKSVVYDTGLNIDAANKWTSGNSVKLPVGNYYLKELHSTNGFYLDTNSYEFTVTANSTTAVEVSDTPIVSQFDAVLKTVSSSTLSPEVQALISTKGATFIVTYYNTIITDQAGLNSAVPVLEATFVTDANGVFTYDSQWYTTEFGQSMYATYANKLKDANGNFMCPQGTFVIREITAPTDLEKSDIVLIVPIEFGSDIVAGSANDPALSTAWTSSLHNQAIAGIVYNPTTGQFEYPNTINSNMDTVAVNTVSGGTELVADVNQSITDTVSISKLVSGFTYKVDAWIVNDNGTPGDTSDDTYVPFDGSTDVNGVPTKTYAVTLTTAGATSANFDIVMSGIDATDLEGCTLTVCENLYIYEPNGVTRHLYLAHTDVTNTKQQVTIPGIRTTLLDTKVDTFDPTADTFGNYTNSTGYTKHIAYGTDETLTDYITFINLIPGQEYEVSGVLKNPETGEDVLDASGNPYTATKTFTPTTKNGVVEVYFYHVDTTKFTTAVVAFEDLYHNGFNVASHAELKDTWQGLHPQPTVITNYLDVQSNSHGAVIGTAVPVTDTVDLTCLVVGETYTLDTVIYNDNNQVFTTKTTFVAGTDSEIATWGTPYQVLDGIDVVDGTITIKTTIDTSGLINITVDPVTGVITDFKTSIVATQKLTYKDVLIAEHTDKSDEDQTVTIESVTVQTAFTDVLTQEHETVTGQQVELVDIASYAGLHVGETYTFKFIPYDQTTGEALKYSDGTPVVVTQDFVPQTADGTVEVAVTLNTADLLVNTFALEERTMVAFEYLYDANGILIGGHTEIDDKPQWVTPKKPVLQTELVDKASMTHEGACGTQVELIDTVKVSNLNIGEVYELRGSCVYVDAEGNIQTLQIATPYAFTATARDMEVQVPFTVNAALLLEGDKSAYVVAFEELWQLNEITGQYELLSSHKDIDDEDQTVTFDTDLKTTALDVNTGTKVLTYNEIVTVSDKVEFTDLNIGETYTATGTLTNKATGEALLDDKGQPYTASTTFEATERDGFVYVVFENVKIPYDVIEVVVFEDLYVEGIPGPIAIHADLTDENQTVERPTASTIATVDGAKQVWLENAEVARLAITDTIEFTNLVPGKMYRIETSLYKPDGTVVNDNGVPATATATFIPETADGTTSVVIYFTTDGLVEGDQVVVFEKIYDVAEEEEIANKTQTTDVLIAVHEDLSDNDQTIMLHYRPKTGLIDTPYAKYGIALIVSAAVGFAVYTFLKKKQMFGLDDEA